MADEILPQVDLVTLKAMRFHARIGVLPHEHELPQPLEVDLTCVVSRGDGVVDYRDLYAAVRESVESRHWSYLEELGDAIADRVLSEKTRVQHAQVALRKPHASVGGPLAHAEVTIMRPRRG